MKKLFKLLILSCFTTIIMYGCGKNNPQPLCRVVTGVDISCKREDVHIQRHYTDTRKMEWVLTYLRLLKPLGKPDTDPDALEKDIYEITVHLSDGSKRFYRQKAHRYFSKENRPWQSINPEYAAGLYSLMQHLPSDAAMAKLYL